jgi:hypothetical protein
MISNEQNRIEGVPFGSRTSEVTVNDSSAASSRPGVFSSTLATSAVSAGSAMSAISAASDMSDTSAASATSDISDSSVTSAPSATGLLAATSAKHRHLAAAMTTATGSSSPTVDQISMDVEETCDHTPDQTLRSVRSDPSVVKTENVKVKESESTRVETDPLMLLVDASSCARDGPIASVSSATHIFSSGHLSISGRTHPSSSATALLTSAAAEDSVSSGLESSSDVREEDENDEFEKHDNDQSVGGESERDSSNGHLPAAYARKREHGDGDSSRRQKPVRLSPPWRRPVCQQIPPKPVLCATSRIPSDLGSMEVAQKDLDTAFKCGSKGRYQASLSIINRFLSSLLSSVTEDILSDTIARENESDAEAEADADSYVKEEGDGESSSKQKQKNKTRESDGANGGMEKARMRMRCGHGTLYRCDRWRVHLLQLAAFCHVHSLRSSAMKLGTELVPWRLLHNAWTLRVSSPAASLSLSASEREALTNLCFETVDLAILNSQFSTAKHILNTCAGRYGTIAASLLMRRSWVNEQLKDHGAALSDAQMAVTIRKRSHHHDELLGAEEPERVIERLGNIFTSELMAEWRTCRLNIAAVALPFIAGRKNVHEEPTERIAQKGGAKNLAPVGLGRGQRLGRSSKPASATTTKRSEKPKAAKPVKSQVAKGVGKTTKPATKRNSPHPTASEERGGSVEDSLSAGANGFRTEVATAPPPPPPPPPSPPPSAAASASASAAVSQELTGSSGGSNKSRDPSEKNDRQPPPKSWNGQPPSRPMWQTAVSSQTYSALPAVVNQSIWTSSSAAFGNHPPKQMYVTQTWGYSAKPLTALSSGSGSGSGASSWAGSGASSAAASQSSCAVASKQTWPSSRPWTPQPPEPSITQKNTEEKSKRRKRSPKSSQRTDDESDREGEEEATGDSAKKLTKKKKTKVGPPSIDLSQFGLPPGTTLPADAWKTEEEVVCQVCCVEPVDTVFLPCVHRIACLQCTKSEHFQSSCPECKTPIERIIQVEAAIEHVMKAIGMKSLLHNREFYDAKNRLATYFSNEAHVSDARDIKPCVIRKIAGIMWKGLWQTVPIPSGGSGKIRHKVVVSDNNIPAPSQSGKMEVAVAGRLMPIVVAHALSGSTYLPAFDLGTFRSRPKITAPSQVPKTSLEPVSRPVREVVSTPPAVSNSAPMPVFAAI